MNKKLAIILISILLLLGLFFGFSKFNGNNSGSQTDEPAAETETKNDYDYLILVNKQNKLPDDWEEKVVLKESVNRYGETYLVEEKSIGTVPCASERTGRGRDHYRA